MKSALAPLALLSVLVAACGLDQYGSTPAASGGTTGSGAAGSGGSGLAGSGGQGQGGGVGGAGPGSTVSSGMGGAGSTGTGGAGGAGGGTGGAGGSGPTCPTGMVLIQAQSSAYCVDRTEVTVGQYKAWLDTNPKKFMGSDMECGWKAGGSYTPRTNGNQCEPKHYDPQNKADYPVVCIDWCDARQYCDAMKKRLCGAIAGGGPLGFDQPKSVDVDELTYACSGSDKWTYPYGNQSDDTKCVGDMHDGVPDGADDDAMPVQSLAGCEGGFKGLYDMSGNVWEWQNSCETGGNAGQNKCGAKGGSFWDGPERLTCSSMFDGYVRNYFNKNVGIRCCADAMP